MSGITHSFVNPKADGADATVVRPSDWNAAHTIAAGTITEAMQVLADNTTGDVATTQHGYAPKAPNDTTKFLRGDATWAVPAGGATLNGITAATGAVTIASGNNTGIVWNWANTADSTVAFTFGETSAATGGTSTSGVPNQVLLKLTTLAASTQSPLSVYTRGNHVFSVSPTTRQLFATNGAFNAPSYSFAASTTSGMYFDGTNTNLSTAGQNNLTVTSSQVSIVNGTAANPGLVFGNNSLTSGLSSLGTNIIGMSTNGIENMRWVGGSTPYFTQGAVTFANLPAAANGSQLYCSDCDPAAAINAACASVGAKTGSMAARINGAWICYT